MQAIRAGTIDVSKDPYHFALPPSWKQGKVANIQSGNFCQVQPRTISALRSESQCPATP